MARSTRVRVFDIEVDKVDRGGAVARIMALLDRSLRLPALVVTPNLDHAVRLRNDARFRGAYAAADLVLADGFPLVLGSRLGREPLPGRVAGSDLVQPLTAAAAARGRSIFVLGTTLEILSLACRRLRADHPSLEIAGVYAPGHGFGASHPDHDEAIAAINACRPDLLFLALGSPKQELWAAAHRHLLDTGVVLCVGAAFDFLAGRPPRAPRVVRRLCLEWLWRLAQDPARLTRRYAVDAVNLPLLLVEQVRDQWRQRWQAHTKPLPVMRAQGLS